MPPSDFRRRRRRRRLSRVGAAVLVGALVVVLGLVVLVGSITSVGKESVPYWRDVDQSYAVALRGLVRQSNFTDTQLRHVVARMGADTRTRLEASLDTLVATSQSLAREAATLSTPAPAAGAGVDITAAMADRAAALVDLRRTVDGLLGMAPLPDPGAGGTTAAPATRTLSAAVAAQRFGAVSALLSAADHLYVKGRSALAAAPGHARLPASAWVSHTVALESGGAQGIVRELRSSRSLAAVEDVVLVPHALVLTPAPVPPAQGSGISGSLRLPPTTRLALTAVVADRGNVREAGVVVDATLAPAHGPSAVERSHPLVLTAHGDASVALPAFQVLPAARYTLTLRVVSPSAGGPAANRTETLSISIAPPAPATVLQVTPPQGSPRGGNAVKILGAGFTSVRAVYFGKARARFTVVAKSQITAIAPPGTGTVTVTVVDRGGPSIGSSVSRYTYKVPKKKKHVP